MTDDQDSEDYGGGIMLVGAIIVLLVSVPWSLGMQRISQWAFSYDACALETKETN
jgi:hypothetical protein